MVEQAKHVKIFASDNISWNLNQSSLSVDNAMGDDLHNLLQWKTHLEADMNAQNSSSDALQPKASGDLCDVRQLTDVLTDTSGTSEQVSIMPHDEASESSLPAVDPS